MAKRTKKVLERQEEIAAPPQEEADVPAEETALVADFILDAGNTKTFLRLLHRKVAIYQSVLFTGEGLTDAALHRHCLCPGLGRCETWGRTLHSQIHGYGIPGKPPGGCLCGRAPGLFAGVQGDLTKT